MLGCYCPKKPCQGKPVQRDFKTCKSDMEQSQVEKLLRSQVLSPGTSMLKHKKRWLTSLKPRDKTAKPAKLTKKDH